MSTPVNNHELAPQVFTLDTSDWWVKVLGMLQHNWAVINSNPDGTVTAYFFHDGGTTKNATGFDFRHTQNMIAIIDSLDFSSHNEATKQLGTNKFHRLRDHPGPWTDKHPSGVIFDARHTEPGIYSKQAYWQTNT
jgi:hypothetical protein